MRSSISSIVALIALATYGSDQARAIFQQAQAREKAGDWSAAEQLYRRVTTVDPSSAEAFANLGVMQAKQGRYPEAVEAYRRALVLKPAFFAVRSNLGLALLKSGRAREATAEFRKFLEKQPDNRAARQLLATALLESDRYQEAASEYERLLPTEDLSIQLGLATAYVRLGRAKEAEPLFASVLRHEDTPAVQIAVGQAYLAANAFSEAEAALRRAIALDPKTPGAHFYLGSVYWKKQEPEAAAAEWKQELAVDETSFEANFALGAALAETQKLSDAEGYLARARALRPSHGPTLYYLGRVYWKTGRPAHPLIEESVRLDPENRAAHYLLAQIYKSRGMQRDLERELAIVRQLAARQMEKDIDILDKARQ